MATIERRTGKNGQLVYRVKVRRRGSLPQTATFTKLSAARKWAKVTEGAAIEGRHFPTAEAKHHTLSDLLERYIQNVLPHKRTSPEDSREGTLRWWQAQLGHCLLVDLTPARIAEHRDMLARGKRAKSTMNYYLRTLSPALTVAVKEWGGLDDSPMRKVTKLKEPRGRVRFLSNEERERLLAACQVSN